ncbi:hypothetical protein CGMCC3_g15806 [Colletotrichum fructicola]|uniref:Glycerate dehydrogenase n=1 Tax=Colletotrichum fructicola (strain Nara gc5) TaxID=1213859 RepID=L2FJP5_COLFN|nr:uncharacterized protein CGMCC3_g15806 [Colletotrichum fructicola]KAE9568107.1 hypothetical protein CGMCC3_g15806 [Colletotrichum fructicola]KAF4412052.1 Glycerate dehydrogenase [Colletotrichum fructicola]KAF4478438.1 Glycerate dehydrogenase [Colletotrichum fructicola Nara gc5]
MKHHVVCLDAAEATFPDFDFPHTRSLYERTQPHEVAERIKDATIVVTSVVPITPDDLAHACHLQCVAIAATGFEWLDRAAFVERRITVFNCPQSNVEAVGEHFLTLYFSARRKVVEVHAAIMSPEKDWIREGSLTPRWTQGPPLSCEQEVLGIIGYGALGKRIETLARALGFGKVLIADRKGESKPREGRASFDDLIKRATTIVVCCPKDPETMSLISDSEFHSMRKEALLVNLARGGVVDEQALATALKEERIFGAAVDVFETEPGGVGTTPLIPDIANGETAVPNLTLSSHVAWFSQKTIKNLQDMLKLGVESFVEENIDEDRCKRLLVIQKGEVRK